MKAIAKADEWIVTDCWVACFDILGIRNVISVEEDDMKAFMVRVDYERTIEHLKSSCEDWKPGIIDYCWFSDTFLMFSIDASGQSYSVIETAAKFFIEDCIYSGIPMRGAISVGRFMRSIDNRCFVGKAFIDAFEYAEDQDWIGLLMTPNAIAKAESLGLYPARHDFVRSTRIPLCRFKDKDVMAYRFQNGMANFSSPLLPKLKEMKQLSEPRYCHKYERTEEFIEENYRYINAKAND